MKVKKLLEILDNKCPTCSKILEHSMGNWHCSSAEHRHMFMTQARGNLWYLYITYGKYSLSYTFSREYLYINKAEAGREPKSTPLLFSFECDNIEQFLIDNKKDMENKIDKLLILL
jgi:hypothetical protein